ncbi:hypothetical protein VTN00DRAFT_1720 [Thermoascus crustaceus]|uniref:uncharacterized protein n=1 Tax=Thermoascus crustaceus TaxID=5088 RepID=UPI0037427FE9
MLRKSNVLCCGGLQLLNQAPPPSRPPPASRGRPHLHSQSHAQPCRRRFYATIRDWADVDLSWPTTPTFTPYDIFKQERNAPYSKARFYALVKIYHPDMPCNGHPLCKDISHEVRLQRYRLVVTAHEILSDPIKRAAYDKWGIGWHSNPDINSSSSDSTGDAARRSRTGRDDPIYANATWEDWERYYNRHNPEQRAIVDHRTFVTFLLLLTLFGAGLQVSWLGQYSVAFEQRIQDMNEKSVRFLTGRRQQTTTQMNSSEARVQQFLMRRDPSGSGLKEGEEDVYRQVLDPRSRTPLVKREKKAGSGEIDEVNEGS